MVGGLHSYRLTIFCLAHWCALLGVAFAGNTSVLLWMLPLMLGCGFIARLFFHRRWGLLFFWAAAGSLFAWISLFLCNVSSSESLAAQLNSSKEYAWIQGVIVSDPEVDAGKRFWHFDVHVDQLKRTTVWQSVDDSIPVVIPYVDGDDYTYGQRWIFRGTARSVPSVLTTLPDHAAFRGDWQGHQLLAIGEGSRFHSACVRNRRLSAEILGSGVGDHSDTARVMRALVLGYRYGLPEHLQQLYQDSGTFHIFAISGLHVGIIALILVGILRFSRISMNHWAWVLVPILFIYVFAVGAPPSAVRALIMAAVYYIALSLLRRPDGVHGLCIAASMILFFSPEQLFKPGFLLSFSVTGGLIILFPMWQRRVMGFVSPHPWQLTPFYWQQGVPRRVLLIMGNAAGVACIAWIVSAPLTALWFHRITPIGIFANLLIGPLIFAMMMLGAESIVISGLFPVLSTCLNLTCALLLKGVLHILTWLESLPLSHLNVVAPPALTLVAFAFMIICFASHFPSRLKRFAATALLLLAMGGWLVSFYPFKDEAHVIDVGQGNALLWRFRDLHTVLIDAGPDEKARKVIRYLRAAGVNTLDTLIIMSSDQGSWNGAQAVVDAFDVKEIRCLNPLFFHPSRRHRWGAQHYAACITALRKKGVDVQVVSAEDSWYPAAGWTFRILYPLRGATGYAPVDATLVLEAEKNGAIQLLHAGMGHKRVEMQVMKQHGAETLQHVSWLHVADHGADGTCCDAWLKLLQPDNAVISVDYYNSRGDPARNVLYALEREHAEIHRTDLDGTIDIAFQ